jgi:hypothetical protein
MESPIAIIAGDAEGVLGRAAADDAAGDGDVVVDDLLEPPHAAIVAAEASAKPARSL